MAGPRRRRCEGTGLGRRDQREEGAGGEGTGEGERREGGERGEPRGGRRRGRGGAAAAAGPEEAPVTLRGGRGQGRRRNNNNNIRPAGPRPPLPEGRAVEGGRCGSEGVVPLWGCRCPGFGPFLGVSRMFLVKGWLMGFSARLREDPICGSAPCASPLVASQSSPHRARC